MVTYFVTSYIIFSVAPDLGDEKINVDTPDLGITFSHCINTPELGMKYIGMTIPMYS